MEVNEQPMAGPSSPRRIVDSQDGEDVSMVEREVAGVPAGKQKCFDYHGSFLFKLSS